MASSDVVAIAVIVLQLLLLLLMLLLLYAVTALLLQFFAELGALLAIDNLGFGTMANAYRFLMTRLHAIGALKR